MFGKYNSYSACKPVTLVFKSYNVLHVTVDALLSSTHLSTETFKFTDLTDLKYRACDMFSGKCFNRRCLHHFSNKLRCSRAHRTIVLFLRLWQNVFGQSFQLTHEAFNVLRRTVSPGQRQVGGNGTTVLKELPAAWPGWSSTQGQPDHGVSSLLNTTQPVPHHVVELWHRCGNSWKQGTPDVVSWVNIANT